MIACIICGGVGEVMLIMAGLGWLIRWLKKRHDRSKCKCCQEHEHKLPLANSRPLSPEEKSSLHEFFMSHFKDKK